MSLLSKKDKSGYLFYTRENEENDLIPKITYISICFFSNSKRYVIV